MESRRRSRSRHQPHRRRSRSGSEPSPARRRHHESRSPPRKRRRSHSRSPDRRQRTSHSHSPSRRRRRSRSHSPDPRRRRPRSRSRSPGYRASRKPLPPQEESYRSQRKDAPDTAVDNPPPKEKPNFQPSGLLAAETNKVTIGSGHKAQDIVLKYHEPPEARKPPTNQQWQVFIFKGESKDPLDTIPLYRRSCWLMGREGAVVDLPLEHPSCSKQHAVFQFRHTTSTNEYGEKKSKVSLYLLDLESSNGSFLNDKRVSPARYVECRSGDVVKFAESSREYVVLLPPK